jgi:hypothetical protein
LKGCGAVEQTAPQFPSPYRVCGGTAKPFLHLQNVLADIQNVY